MNIEETYSRLVTLKEQQEGDRGWVMTPAKVIRKRFKTADIMLYCVHDNAEHDKSKVTIVTIECTYLS